jgi:hypothetical protein
MVVDFDPALERDLMLENACLQLERAILDQGGNASAVENPGAAHVAPTVVVIAAAAEAGTVTRLGFKVVRQRTLSNLGLLLARRG